MEKQLIQLDTSVLIDYFRKTQKSNTFFVEIAEKYDSFAISVITKFEIYMGCNEAQRLFWDKVLADFALLPLSNECIETAIVIQQKLKKINKQMDFADLLIAATAQYYQLALATLNEKHFVHIESLDLLIRK